MDTLPPRSNEISLVDHIVVVLKRRRLVIGLTLLSFVLYTMWAYLFPMLGLVSRVAYTVQALVVPVQIPGVLKTELGMDPAALAINYALDLVPTADAAIRHQVMEIKPEKHLETWELRSLIAEDFLGKKYRVNIGPDGIRLSIIVADIDAGKAFLSDRILQVEDRLRTELAEHSEAVSKAMLSLYSVSPAPTALSEAAKQLIVSSYNFSGGDQKALTIIAAPDVINRVKTTNRIKMGITVMFAVFFLSIFLTFVLEYMEKIRKDPESMEKIQFALRKGK